MILQRTILISGVLAALLVVGMLTVTDLSGAPQALTTAEMQDMVGGTSGCHRCTTVGCACSSTICVGDCDDPWDCTGNLNVTTNYQSICIGGSNGTNDCGGTVPCQWTAPCLCQSGYCTTGFLTDLCMTTGPECL